MFYSAKNIFDNEGGMEGVILWDFRVCSKIDILLVLWKVFRHLQCSGCWDNLVCPSPVIVADQTDSQGVPTTHQTTQLNTGSMNLSKLICERFGHRHKHKNIYRKNKHIQLKATNTYLTVTSFYSKLKIISAKTKW